MQLPRTQFKADFDILMSVTASVVEFFFSCYCLYDLTYVWKEQPTDKRMIITKLIIQRTEKKDQFSLGESAVDQVNQIKYHCTVLILKEGIKQLLIKKAVAERPTYSVNQGIF